MEFKINTVKADMDCLNKVFSEQKLERIEKTFGDIMKIDCKIENL